MLDLRLSSRAGRVEIASDAASGRYLQSLRGRFATATSISQVAFEVGIDDLLVNLHELTSWPAEDTDVRWQKELLDLVEANAGDAATLQAELVTSDGAAAPPTAVLGETWEGDLTDFQRRDLGKLLSLSHGANFSVPGAGKTRVALANFDARRQAGEVSRMLVVCPKSAFESWRVEALECFPAAPLRLTTFGGSPPGPTDVLLVNYERLPDAQPLLLQWLRAHPTLLVLDEAHRMKLGPAGAWGSACLTLAPYATKRLILTGTPAPNGARDLENLFAFVWPGQGRSSVSRALAGRDLRAASEQLRPLFARTTKNELNLPPVDIAVRRVQLPPLHRDLYNALLGQMSRRWRGGEEDTEALGRVLLYLLMAATTPALLATGTTRHEPLPYRVPPLTPPEESSLAALMRDLPHYEMSPKYREALEIVAENASANRKTLVWSTFVRNLTSLGALLDGFQPAVIHGGTEDRDAELARFRTNPDCKVLLSNPATLGEGVSLHHVCHDAVYIDRDFAAGRFLQSLDRIHRLGLAPGTETRITVLVADETIDEIVEQRLAAKLRFMGGVLDDPAVLALADLNEEPTATVGMDGEDLKRLAAYLDSATG